MNAPADLAFAPWLNRLMGGWRDIVEDTRRLADVSKRLPDHCECGSGSGTGDRCRCCRQLERPFPEQCRTCADEVARVSSRLGGVVDDTMRYLPALEATRVGVSVPFRELLRDVEVAAFRVVRVMDRLKSATGEFEHGCRTMHVAHVKDACERLRGSVERAHARLRAL